MQPTLNIQTTTNQYLARAWVDQTLKDNFFSLAMLGNVIGMKDEYEGSQMLFPIKYQKGVASVAFNGFDQLPTSQQPVSVNMIFLPTFVATNVALAGSDLSVNKTEMQTINLMKIAMKSRAQDGADDVGNFFQSNGTAFGGKAPNGLLNLVDNGSVASVIGGLSRATYPGMNSVVTASGGTISLLKIRQLDNGVTDGQVTPDFALTDYTTWSYVEQLLQPFQRNTYTDFTNMEAGAGYKAKGLIWDGMIIYKDKKITPGYFYLLNLEFLKFYGLNWWEGTPVSLADKKIEGNVYTASPATSVKAFTWTDWIRAYGQGAVNAFMILGGQLLCTNPSRQAVLTGITGV